MKTRTTLYLGAALAAFALAILVGSTPALAGGDRYRCDADLELAVLPASHLAGTDASGTWRWELRVRDGIADEKNDVEAEVDKLAVIEATVLSDSTMTTTTFEGLKLMVKLDGVTVNECTFEELAGVANDFICEDANRGADVHADDATDKTVDAFVYGMKEANGTMVAVASTLFLSGPCEED